MRYFAMGMPDAPTIGYLRRHLPGLTFIADRGLGATDTWRRMLEAIGQEGGIAVEDDVILTRGFTTKAEAAVRQHPDVLIQFHSRTRDDVTIGSRWRSAVSFYNNQGLYYPPGFATGCLAWCDSPEGQALWATDPTGYDRAMAFYMKASQQRYWNHVPSLVEHLQVPSRIDPRRSKFRGSTTFTDPEVTGHPYPHLHGRKP